jgi:oxygen-independent coproporphyrinogen-3 oxidase
MSKKDMLLECMREEIISRSRYWEGKELATIYIGGGTPSLLDGNDVEVLLHTVREYMTVSPTAEITIESNPDDVSYHKTRQWIDAGINRVSIGVQSFCDDTLSLIGRRHTGEKAREAIGVLRDSGIDNISLDIIYGIPTRSDDVLLDDIRYAVSSGVKHISAYALTREEGTIMDKMIKRGTFPPLDEEMMERQYHIVCNELEKEGFVHYEISNYAKKGYRSRHNSAYWRRVPYVGIGPAAHSFCGDKRRWNVSSVASYIEGIKGNTVYWEEEELTDRDVHNEIIMTSLRCVEGVDLGEIRERFGEKYAERIKMLSVRYIESGLLTEDNDRIKLTRNGVFLSDGIEADFFLTDDDK